MESPVKIRPATEADKDFLGWVMQAAARGNHPDNIGPWDIFFGD